MSDRADTVINFLAAASCATCAPLNPTYTFNEFKFFLSDLKTKILITDQKRNSPAIMAAQCLKIKIIDYSLIKPGTAKHQKKKESAGKNIKNCFSNLNDVALMLYTSGTTNKPKIVPLTHNNIIASIKNISRVYKLSQKDRCLNFVPLYHVHGLLVALSTLANGGSLFCVPFEKEKFYSRLNNFRPTWYTAVPALHRAIVSLAKENPKISAYRHLRFIRSSSAPLPRKIATDLEKIFKAPISESYGMTEATLQITANPLPPKKRQVGSVGQPFGLKIGIIDEDNKFLPPEKSGEIVIKGKNIFSKYKNNFKANKESFIKGWFKTGDWGHIDNDGFLFISGRLKEIINRGGEKISPREIDEVFLEHPSVENAASFAIPHPALGEDIAIALIFKKNAATTEADLKKFAAKKLANFKIPSRIIKVKDLPAGPGGKLKRSALHEKFKHLLTIKYQKPFSKIEIILTQIWQEILGVKKIGINDNFFDLGGDSLKMTELINKINEYGWSFSPVEIMNKPSISHLAKLIRNKYKKNA